MDQTERDCEVCGAPGEPSWGGVVLCENCYGTAGAVCSGLRVPPKPVGAGRPPAQAGAADEKPGVC